MGSTGPSGYHLIIHSTAHKLTKYNTLGHFGTLINIQGLCIVVFLGLERKPLKTLPTAVNTLLSPLIAPSWFAEPLKKTGFIL